MFLSMIAGNMINNFTIVGHNDGLRFNPSRNELWALQNEDGNVNLSIIKLSNANQTIYQLGTGPHEGGYDDIDFNNGQVYISASAPKINPNRAPAIVSLKLKGERATLRESSTATHHGRSRGAESSGSRLDDCRSNRRAGDDLAG